MNGRPIVMCIGGHDPTGGAGIQADIETVAALGGYAMTVITALTTQDTRNIHALFATPGDVLESQFSTLIKDLQPAAVKIGLLGDPSQAARLAALLHDVTTPVVLDPVLAAGGGFDAGGERLARELATHLLPLCTLITPNIAEARLLSGETRVERAAGSLHEHGCNAVLITGADEAKGQRVVNRLFRAGEPTQHFDWPRLPGSYHGSGCTLASACTTGLALGHDLVDSVDIAQAFTYRALQHAERPGQGQALPERTSP